jgi:hypothetical protein
VLAAACRNDPPPQTEDITIWQPRGHWAGHGLLQTDPFISTTGLLRVTWQSRTPGTPGTPGTLRIVLHSDVSGRSLVPVVEHTGSGSGVKYISEDPRSFFFVIEATGVDWQVEVAEGFAATRKAIAPR